MLWVTGVPVDELLGAEGAGLREVVPEELVEERAQVQVRFAFGHELVLRELDGRASRAALRTELGMRGGLGHGGGTIAGSGELGESRY